MSQERDNYWLTRRVSRRGVVRGASLGAAGLALAGCTTPAAQSTPASGSTSVAAPTTTGARPATTVTAAARQPKYGSVHKGSNGSGETPHLDPHQTNSSALVSHGPGMAWSQLLYYKNGPDIRMPNYEVEGDLAERWDQPDDTTYVFKLRPGVKYHNVAPVNGREVDAEDVVQSFRRQIDKRINASYLAGVRTIEATDRSTVRISVEQPNADFLWGLATAFCKILPRETLASDDLREGPVIGSGPYLMGEWESGKSITMRRNPDYYQRGRPYLDGMQWYRIGDSATLVSAFRSKNLDAMSVGVTKQDADTVKRESPEAVVTQRPGNTRFELGLKGDRPPLSDIRVRQAIFKAVNRQEIIDTIFGGVARVGTGLTVASTAQELPESELNQIFAYDLAGAQRLLREANVSSFDLDLQVGNFLAGLVTQVGELIQAQLRRVNINVNLRVVEGSVFTGPIRVQGQYTAYLGLQSTPAPTSTELFNRHHSKGPQFTTGIADPELDSMIERQGAMVRDQAGRARLIQDIQRKTISLYGYNMIVVQNDNSVAWPYVKDWNPNAATNNVNGDFIWTWHDK